MESRIFSFVFPLIGIAVAGIHFSPAIASVALGFAMLIALLEAKEGLKNKAPMWIWIAALLILWQIVAQLFTGWQPGMADKLLLKLPLLCFPLLYLIAKMEASAKYRLITLTGINLVHFWIAAASIINYAAHFKFYNQMILESKPIPLFSQVYHIEFSLMLAVFALAGIFETRRRGQFFSNLLFWLSVGNAVLVFLVSVRTGMLGVLSGLGFVLLFEMKKNKKALWFLPALMVALATAFLVVPGLKNRLNNTIEDIETVANDGDVRDKSLGRRWFAWNAALKASAAAPVAGYGMKGVEDAMNTGYEKQKNRMEESNRVMPHNEFLDLLLQSGWPALLLFLLLGLSALLFYLKTKSKMGLAVWAALFAAAFFESYLERQAGILLFVSVLLMVNAHKKVE